MPMSISAPGIASRRSSAPASAPPTTRSPISPTSIRTAGYGFGRNPSKWNFAWALYAGVSYTVSKNFNIDLTYRYLNLGSVTDTVDCSATCNRTTLQVQQSVLAGHHAGRALDLLRCAGAEPRVRLHAAAAAAAAAAAQQGLSARPMVNGARNGEKSWLNAA